MKTVRVELGQRSYDILIGEDILLSTGSHLRSRGLGRRLVLIANPSVHELYGDPLQQALVTEGFDVFHLLIPEGEQNKNLHTVENIHTFLIAEKADRRTTLLALGGGVTGDIVGFVAATFLRGVRYVQIPTTLLAQVDSSVGGKTGVNHRLGKNLIGAFYQPHLVLADTRTLRSLPEREFRAGMYEAIKYGLISDRAFFEWMEANLDSVMRREGTALEHLVSRCCELKAEVTRLDETESDLRRILNFGHTLGHALEAATEYHRFLHGEAVAYGTLAATHLSRIQGLLPADEAERISRLVLRIGRPPSAADVAFNSLAEAMLRDKKRRDDQTVFVLLPAIGRTVIQAGFSEQLLAEVWARAVAEVEA